MMWRMQVILQIASMIEKNENGFGQS
jgi:hypothetical protein